MPDQVSRDILQWIKFVPKLMRKKYMGSTATITQLLFKYGRVITADDQGLITVCSDNGDPEFRLKHMGGVSCLATTETKLVSGSDDTTIRIWDLRTRLCTHVFRGHTDSVRYLLILRPEPEPDHVPGQQLRDRSLIISGSHDGVQVWILPGDDELECGRKGRDLNPAFNPYHLYNLTARAVSVGCIAANRNTVLSAGDDLTVYAYDMKTVKTDKGVIVTKLRGHTAKITSVAIKQQHSNGAWYSASLDGTIRMYSESGDFLASSSQHPAGITSMFDTTWGIITVRENGAITGSTTDLRKEYLLDSADKFMVNICGDYYTVLASTEASVRMLCSYAMRPLYRCKPGEKLSLVAFDSPKCVFMYKTKQEQNVLVVLTCPSSESMDLGQVAGSYQSGPGLNVADDVDA